MKFLVLLLILVGCGQKEPKFNISGYGTVPDGVTVFYNRFMDYAQCFNANPMYIDIKISFAPTSDGEATAECYRRSNGYNEIIIDPTVWAAISDTSRERVFFHEMGHCYLNLNHVEQTFEPYIMTPAIRSSYTNAYRSSYDENIKQLFGNAPTTCSFAYTDYVY